MNAIRKEERKKSKSTSMRPPIHTVVRLPHAQDISSMSSSAHVHAASNPSLPANTLFARTGRRYGARSSRRSYTPHRFGKNPMRNGQYLRCRQCESEDHFIRDCPEANKNKLVYFAVQNTGESDYDLSFNDTLDLIQELPEEKWKALLASTNKTEDNEESANNDHEPAEVFHTRSAEYSELYRLFPVTISLPKEKPQLVDSKCLYTSSDDSNVNKIL